VSPTELEQILLTHPDIIEAAVAPVPDEAAGELPRAYVVKSPGSTLTEDDVAKFVAGSYQFVYYLFNQHTDILFKYLV
jgi:acyl-coenzyme A synthetase/AMP-(fatty) acid ligase